MADLAAAGISMKEVTDKLTADGVKLFADAFDKLLAAVEKNSPRPAAPTSQRANGTLPADLDAAVKKNVNDWRASGKVRRLWQKDASLWTGETKTTGWAGSASLDEQLANTPRTQGLRGRSQSRRLL